MITIRSTMLAIVLTLSGMSLASAAAVTYTDIYDANGILLSNYGGTPSDSWIFDITDDGFDPALEVITLATVSLNLRDDIGKKYKYDKWWEFARLSSGNTVIDTWEVDTGTEVIMLTSLIQLNATGMLSMTLEAKKGDFYFDLATLDVKASPVPVPAAVWLFGSGLISLAGFARARQKA